MRPKTISPGLLISFVMIFYAFGIGKAQTSEAIQEPQKLTEKKLFIENKGQWPDEVLYLTQTAGLNVWITKSGARYDYYQLIDLPQSAYNDNDWYLYERYKEKKHGVIGHVIDIANHQANTQPIPQGIGKSSAYYNYFLGNDPSKWAGEVGLYEEAVIKNIYPNIDQRWYYDNGSLRYDYIVHPQGDPSLIKLKIDGTSHVQIKENNLLYQTRFGEVIHSDLLVYQESTGWNKNSIPAQWKIQDEYISFQLGQYDKTKPLIIDPIIQSTYIGSTNQDYIYDLSSNAVIANRYVCGATLSSNYPITIGSYDQTYSADFDVVVTAFPVGLNSLIFSTFLGHTGEDRAYAIKAENGGGIYVAGITYSASFPTFNAYDNSYFSNGDVFVTKLNNSGSSLLYSTFMGFGGTEAATAIDISVLGEVFITGRTTGGFPVTSGVVQTSLIGTQNAFITKLNPSGNTLGFSTFFGRSNEIGYSIKADVHGNVYVSGETNANNLPVTPGAADATYNGGKDAFVLKLNPTATQILALTYLGGSNDEIYARLDVDFSTNVYVAGGSSSTNFPTTPGAYVNNPGNGYFDVFVTKLNPDFTSMVYSTKFGQTFDDYAQDIAVDAGGFAHIAALVDGASFPTTAGADYITARGMTDAAIVKLNQDGSNLRYSSYYGGMSYDVITAIDLDKTTNERVVFAGYTQSSNYHTAGVPYQSTLAGFNDGFCTSIQICAIVNPNSTSSVPATSNVCSGSSVTYTMTASGGTAPYTYIWTEYYGNAVTNTATATLTPPNNVPYMQYAHVATDNNGCMGGRIITVIVDPAAGGGTPSGNSVCLNQAISPAITINTTNATGIGTPGGLPPGVTASYSSNTISITGTPTSSGTFNYTIPLTGTCPGNATGTLEVIPGISFGGAVNQTACINSALSPMNITTTGVTGIGTPTNLPPGVNATFSSNTVTISGTPTSSGTFNYTIPLNGCGTGSISGTITVNPTNTFSGTTDGTTCINTPLTPIILSTTGATGISGVINLPAGVSAAFSSNTITISGTPTVSGTFNYSINLDGGCGNVTVNGTITVNANNTVTGSGNQTLCVNSTLSPIVFNTTGATGIGTPSGLPPGVTASWNSNTLTISGTPTSDGVFSYSIPLTGGCGSASATGTITVNPANTVSGSGNQTVCMNYALTPITFTTTGATGIGTPSGLPFGVTASFSSNTITISGTPTMQGVYNYSIPLTGGCGSVNATGTITVNGFITLTPITTTFTQACTNTPMTPIMYLVPGATSIGSVSNLPPGVNAALSDDTLIISGSPTTVGSYNFDVIVNGCGAANANGYINVIGGPTITGNPNQTLCAGSPVSISVTTTQVYDIGTPVGLPAGVTASFNSNSVSISGTSNVPGVYNYSIALISDCNNATLSGTITINPAATISLTSTPGSDNQSICTGSSITDITYSITNAAGATVSGLPAGVTGVYNSGIVTISGTPTVTGTFNFTVATTGGCDNPVALGSITVNELPATINLSSSTGSDNQTVCSGTAISDITYAVTDAANATFTGLPTGVNGTYNSGVVTISGTPTVSGTFNYTVTVIGGCDNATAAGTLIVDDCPSGITANDVLNNLSIYPNPASTQVTISGEISGSTLKIMDMAGKIVRVENIHEDTHMLSVQLLADGVYSLHIEKDGTRIQKKLAVNKQ